MTTAYPFDPSGTSAANRIVNEQHVITAVNFRDYHYVIPKFAPFFAESMVLRMQYPNGNTRTLTQGLDYYFSHQFLDASRACAKPVYGSISFLDTDEAGVLSITYQTVGGIWTLSASEISRILAEQMRNPRITTWEQITYLPERFPVIDHEWDLIDMVGASEVVRAIDDITTTIANSTGGGIQAHVTNYSNPHKVTKAQVGLSNVQNYAVASKVQAEAGTANNLYMTPLRVKESIAIFGQQLVNAHSTSTDNPHAVTKAQVGLGNVQNYPMASSSEAIAGSATDRYISPNTLGAAITSLIRNDFDAHTANTNNPHNVTKAQVGLVYVENFPVASAEEARAGTRTDRYMTPQRTTQLMAEYVNTRLMEHELRIDNPHEVNKVQVGLGQVQNYPMADLSAATDPSSMSHYVSPAVAAAIALAKIDEYMGSTENPAGVTKAMVGLANVENYLVATKAQAEAGAINTAYMTPLRTKEAINAIAVSTIDAHASRQDNPHAVTKAQVGLSNVDNYKTATTAETVAGTSSTSFVTPAGVGAAIAMQLKDIRNDTRLQEHIDNKDNPHNVTAAGIGAVTLQEMEAVLDGYLTKTSTDVSGMSQEEFIALTLSGTASDSEKFASHTPESFASWLSDFKLTNEWVRNGVSKVSIDLANMTTVGRGAAILLAEITPDDFILSENDDSDAGLAGQEVCFLVNGGQVWNNTVAGGIGFTNSSPTFLVTASLKNAGVSGGSPELRVVQLTNFGVESQAYIEFGYRYTGDTLSIYMTTSKSHRPVVVNKLSPFGLVSNSLETVEPVPANMTYVSIQRGVDNAIRLNGRSESYFATASSVTSMSNAQSLVNTAVQTTLDTHGQDISRMNNRLTTIENLLSSITVV